MTDWIKHMRWAESGIAPPDNLINEGLSVGYKPPAPLFNYFFNQNMRIIDQLQTEVDNKDTQIREELNLNFAKKDLSNVNIDTELNDESTHPVQNKAIKSALDNKVNKSAGLGLMGFGTSNTTGKTRDTILMIDSDTGLPVIKTLVTYQSDLKLDMQSVKATSTNGISYSATIDGITELFAGLTLTIIPDKTSASVSPTLNLNNLGAKSIKRSLSSNTALSAQPTAATWLVANYPVQIMYDGTCWKTTTPRTDANDIYGTVPVEKGGTGVTSIDEFMTLLRGEGRADVILKKYSGSGYRGKDYPKTISFAEEGLVPQFVIVTGGTKTSYTVKSLMMGRGSTKESAAMADATVNVTWGNNSVSWYDSYITTSATDTNAAIAMKNESGVEYCVIAIG